AVHPAVQPLRRGDRGAGPAGGEVRCARRGDCDVRGEERGLAAIGSIELSRVSKTGPGHSGTSGRGDSVRVARKRGHGEELRRGVKWGWRAAGRLEVA